MNTHTHMHALQMCACDVCMYFCMSECILSLSSVCASASARVRLFIQAVKSLFQLLLREREGEGEKGGGREIETHNSPVYEISSKRWSNIRTFCKT